MPRQHGIRGVCFVAADLSFGSMIVNFNPVCARGMTNDRSGLSWIESDGRAG